MLLVAGGVLLGTAGALCLSRILSSMLFGVKPEDPATYVAVVTLFLLAALAANYIPARRATRGDPGMALRDE
jgi:putative ABC transport system permease protein